MRGPIVERVAISGSPDQVWSIVDDPDALGRVLPGIESLAREAPDRFRAVIAMRTGFMTIRADVTAGLGDPDPPRHLLLEIDGRARGLPGTFRVRIPIDLSPDGENRTSVAYAVELEVTGSLAAFGTAALQEALRAQVRELVRNIEREIASS